MSSHADTIRDYTTNTERYDGQWHRLPTEQEVLAALDALLAEIEEWRVLSARQLEQFTVTTQKYRAENQRLREALGDAATSLHAADDTLNDADQFASGSIAHDAAFIAEDTLAREALAGDAE